MKQERNIQSEELQEGENSGQKAYKDSEFILLDDLVYAPLHALAKSNYQLRRNKKYGYCPSEGTGGNHFSE